jgi:hypothetical protein
MSIHHARAPIAYAAILAVLLRGVSAEAQEPAPDTGSPMTREASGTAWLPDQSPMYAVHGEYAGWDLMGHGTLFLQYLRDEEPRGYEQAGSINWFMGMASRQVGPGIFGLKAMMSLEPLTIRGCGYPDLLASGERCESEAIVDRQHPHDLFMELAATWESPSAGGLRLHFYGGPVGEPALGPVAYPHRVSAIANPIAPISHHWLDATHITFGVATIGLHGRRWKAEGSVFNGREPDERRYDFDLGPLDSYSGRFWFLPTDGLAVQFSVGHLSEAELGDSDLPGHDDPHQHEAPETAAGLRIDVDRVTASATYHQLIGQGPGVWASTAAWGRNIEAGESTDFLLLETMLNLADRHAIFSRVDVGRKEAHDLNVDGIEGAFTVSKLQGGYVRYVDLEVLKVGLGVTLTASLLPERLQQVYGGRTALGGGVFLSLRPRAMMMTGDAPDAEHVH